MSGKGCCAVMQVVETDNEWLKKSASEARAVKMSLVQQHYPQLVSEFLQKEKSGASKQIQVNKKKADAKVCANCPGPLFGARLKPCSVPTPACADRMKHCGIPLQHVKRQCCVPKLSVAGSAHVHTL